MFKKKGQFSVEFLLIFVFMMSVVSIIIVVLGTISIEVSLDEKRKEVDDFANSILKEFEIMQSVEGGYLRNFKVPVHFMDRFNVKIEGDYLVVTDLYSYESEKDFIQYYKIPGDNTLNTKFDVEGNFIISLCKDFSSNLDPVDFFSASGINDDYCFNELVEDCIGFSSNSSDLTIINGITRLNLNLTSNNDTNIIYLRDFDSNVLLEYEFGTSSTATILDFESNLTGDRVSVSFKDPSNVNTFNISNSGVVSCDFNTFSITNLINSFGQWIGGSGFDKVNSISVDSLNNFYVGGSTRTDITDDGLGTISGTYSGSTEGFVFKFNSSGGYEWGQWLGVSGFDVVSSISVDSLNNVYVGGYAQTDITDDGLGNISGTHSGGFEAFVFKFNSSGGYEWGQWLGGTGGAKVNSISVDSLNNVYVGGYAGTDITDDGLGNISGTYSGTNEGFVFKFNSSGGYEWGQWLGGASGDNVNSISVDSLNNLYVGGYAGTDITDDGIGTISGTYFGSIEGFVFKFNSSGSFEWGQWLGGSDYDVVSSISFDSLENLYVGGSTATDITDDGLGTISGTYSGGYEAFVFKFNSSGSYEWGQWIGGASNDGVYSISVDSLNNVYVGGNAETGITDDGLGNISGTHSGVYEGFVFKFNSSGSSEWGQWIGGASSDNVNSISVDSLNNVYVGGYAQTDINDDGLETISGTYSGAAGNTEGFVFKFEPVYE
jgi:hypothetical protein